MPRKKHSFFARTKISWYPTDITEHLKKDMFMDGMAQMPRTFASLHEHLLTIGGEMVVPGRGETDKENVRILGGQFFPSKACFVEMKPSQCHSNIAQLYDSGAPIWIATGYALSDDGRWRSHTWGVLRDSMPCGDGFSDAGDVVETTEPREAYFGYILDKRQSEAFVNANL